MIILWNSLFKNLTIVLFVFQSLCYAAICDLSSSMPIFCKTRIIRFSKSFAGTELGMLENSTHSLLEYCSNLCYCLLSCTGLLIVILNTYCKTFVVFCATVTWLDNSLFFLSSFSFSPSKNLRRHDELKTVSTKNIHPFRWVVEERIKEGTSTS